MLNHELSPVLECPSISQLWDLNSFSKNPSSFHDFFYKWRTNGSTHRFRALVGFAGLGYSAAMKLLQRITVEADKCGGRPCIRGLRIRVTDILGMLAEGVSHEEILRDFPYLEPDDIKAALAYAARQADHAVLQPV